MTTESGEGLFAERRRTGSRRLRRLPLAWLCLLVSPACGLAIPVTLRADESPARRDGIASQYPGDAGIAQDPRVVYAENFETDGIEPLRQRWDMVRNDEIMTLDSDVPPHSAGNRSLLMSQRAELGTGGDLYQVLGEGHDQVYCRMYVKFAEDCQPVHHFGTCVGGHFPPSKWPIVRAGQPPAGDKSFWVGIEPFGESWRWDYYTYWWEMRGSPPRGQTWGNSFIQDPELAVERGRWICVEQMVKLNDVGEANGEMALWIDGVPVSHVGQGFPRGTWIFDKFHPGRGGEGVRWNRELGERETLTTASDGDPFEGFRFRTDASLNINYVWLYLYLTQGTPGHINRVWFDDVVVATDYIGPLQPPR